MNLKCIKIGMDHRRLLRTAEAEDVVKIPVENAQIRYPASTDPFSVKTPFRSSPPAPSTSNSVTPPSESIVDDRKTSRKRDTESSAVLICEDEGINRLYLVKFLSRMNLEVDVAMTGIQAVEKAFARRYDLILMDLGLPEIDGFEATRRIREQESSPGKSSSRVPIIALTAHTFSEDIQRCFETGMDDFISKPVSERTLKQKLGKWLGTPE